MHIVVLMKQSKHWSRNVSLNRYSKKRDNNEKQLVAYMRARGVWVQHVSEANFPDLLCLYRNMWFPAEVKGPREKLTLGQQDFFALARNCNAPAYVIRAEKDVDLLLADLDERYEDSRKASIPT
jgi:hypothetical protein